jgi:hypothetical protein
MMPIVGPLVGVSITTLFLGWAVLQVWLGQRHKERMRAMAQEEHFRRLELNLGDVDADLARAEADKTRTRTIGLIGVVVPVVTCLALVALTVLLPLLLGQGTATVALLLTAWPAGLAVCLGTAALSLWLLRGRGVRPPADKTDAPRTNREAGESVATGIREAPVGR